MDNRLERLQLGTDPDNYLVEGEERYILHGPGVVNRKVLEEYVDEGRIQRDDHEEYPLHLYKYTKNHSFTPATRIARGLIVNTRGVIVARPFYKFFNYCQWHKEEWFPPDEEPHVLEKEDGSLIIVYYWGGGWRAASSGKFNSQHVQKAAQLLEDVNMSVANPKYTYLFEMVSDDPAFQIVRNYDEEELVLLGARHRVKGEHSLSDLKELAGGMGVRLPEVHSKGESEALEEAEELDVDREGYVLWYPESNIRAKVKGEAYREAHKVVSKGPYKRVVESIDSEDGSVDQSLIRSVDEEIVDEVLNEYTKMQNRLETAYEKAKEKDTRKQQAKYLKQYRDEYELHAVFAKLDGNSPYDVLKTELKRRFEK